MKPPRVSASRYGKKSDTVSARRRNRRFDDEFRQMMRVEEQRAKRWPQKGKRSPAISRPGSNNHTCEVTNASNVFVSVTYFKLR